MLGSNTIGAPALDSKGRLVYRGVTQPHRCARADEPAAACRCRIFRTRRRIVRVDLASAQARHGGVLQDSEDEDEHRRSPTRASSMTSEINPMQIIDDWAVLVRRDDRDRARAGLSHRLGERRRQHHDVGEDAVRLAALERRGQSRGHRLGEGGDGSRNGERPGRWRRHGVWRGGGGGGGEQRQMIVMGSGSIGGGDGASESATKLGPASRLRDLRRAQASCRTIARHSRPGAAKADLDGNLWIRTSAVRAERSPGPIYDVVNRKGELVDRIQVPCRSRDRRVRQGRHRLHDGARRQGRVDRADAPVTRGIRSLN